jgi:hypothetical protein
LSIGRFRRHQPAASNLGEKSSKVRGAVQLDPFEVETITLTLKRDYPMSPHKLLGHVSFWPGLAITSFGFVSMSLAKTSASEYQTSLAESDRSNARGWTGAMWASFGLGAALMTTGVILWAATPSSKEYWNKNHAAGIAPMDHSRPKRFQRA